MGSCDNDGTHEAARRDYYRARFYTSDDPVLRDAARLWPVADTTKSSLRREPAWQKENAGTYIELGDTAVRVHFISKMKPTHRDKPESMAGANAIDLTVHSPKLVQMLRDWAPHAATAQPDNEHAFVLFQRGKATWGCGYNPDSYGKQVKLAWQALVSDYGAPEIGKGETGCRGARHLTKQARRGVADPDADAAEADAAPRMMHSVQTDRRY